MAQLGVPRTVQVPPSPNFGFLSGSDARLVAVAALAETYFSRDPAGCLTKLRTFGEILADAVAEREAGVLEPGPRPSFEERLRRLSQLGTVPRPVLDVLHDLRRLGNAAVHEGEGTHAQALTGLKVAREIGIWFHRVYGGAPGFKAGPFVPPRDPEDATGPMREELEALRARLASAENAEQAALRRARELEAERESLAERLAREAEERRIWEELAAEAEARAADAQARIAAIAAAPADVDFIVAHIAEDAAERLALSRAAAEDITLDEADTRALVDLQLREAGFAADHTRLRHAAGTRPTRERPIAIAEWPTDTGPVDYALFVEGRCVGVIEAKRAGTDVPSVLDQAKRYARSIRLAPEERLPDAPWRLGLEEYRVPFVFATNGRPYVRQLETVSGIWFFDARRQTSRAIALPDWFSPRDLLEKLEQEDGLDGLREEPLDGLGLRPYQERAIHAVEDAVARGRREILVAMATGTGKTLTCIALMHRLLAAKRFRRILFLVDRTALAEQTLVAFGETKISGIVSFGDTYPVTALGERPERAHRVHVATVQSLVRRLFEGEETGERPSPGLYDCIIVDEAHRGYVLDAELREADLAFRNVEDYLSKYRRVLDAFDAVKIALTATPALHTTQIFGHPVFSYGYREAVVDGWLIDHSAPRRITTALSQAGIRFEGGEIVEVLDRRTGEIDLAEQEDAVDFEVEDFNRKVIAPAFNRVVAQVIAREVPPDTPGKTLLFAVDRTHADVLVDELRKALEEAHGPQPHDLVQKITGEIDRPGDAIRRFRADDRPKYVVTVDLLTTGVDIPAITTLVFVRRVNSRILYEQMMGRATRRCESIGKTEFRIFDAVDLYARMQEMSDMRPVVVNPRVSFTDLLAELARAPTPEDRAYVHEQIVVKLRRRLATMREGARIALAETAGRSCESLLAAARAGPPEALAGLLPTRILSALDEREEGPARLTPIAPHEDTLIGVEPVFGTGLPAPDYIAAFERFVKESGNAVPALVAATTRPRALTRAQLKEIAAALGEKGFDEKSLRAAYGRVRNAEIAAHIIGFIRQAAMGDALVPYAERVDRGVARIIASRDWTAKQRDWLVHLGNAMKETPVVDAGMLDEPALRLQLGGRRRAERDFGEALDSVLADLNEAVWSNPAA